MNYITTLLSMSAVFVLVLLGYAGYSSFNVANKEGINEKGTMALAALQPQISTEGPVSVTVIPPAVMPESEKWVFGVTLDTHSADLKEKINEVSFLLDDKGNTHAPIFWQGDKGGGHHRKGTLTFDPIIPKPRSIELVIKKIGGIEKRSFKWIL